MSLPSDPAAAEVLLDGGRPSPAPDRLADLIASAAAPARAEELAGEPAAMAAFERARLYPSPPPRRLAMLRTATAKLFTIKVAVVAAAAAATLAGGVALATTGNLPNPISGLGAAPPSDTGSDVAAERRGGPVTGAQDAPASPSPSLEGLCQAYLAGAGDNPGRALDNPAMRALIKAAGGDEEDVADYCADLLPAGDSRPEVPAGLPSGPPVEHPTPPIEVPGPPADR